MRTNPFCRVYQAVLNDIQHISGLSILRSMPVLYMHPSAAKNPPLLASIIRHSKARSHINAEKAWDVHVARKNKFPFVEIIVLNRIPGHEMCMEALFNVVKFVFSNGLPFRGHDKNADFKSGDVSGGIYLNTFSQLLFQINPKLEKKSKNLPNMITS